MKTVKAVVGMLTNANDEIFIAQRQTHQFMGGYWELPGGKIEVGETPEAALTRELSEELGIKVSDCSLHQHMRHQYADRLVELLIYRVEHYLGEPQGAEGQAVAWCQPEQLFDYQLLPTMSAFIHTLTLPNQYWITPADDLGSLRWMAQLEQRLNSGIKLIQLRSKKPVNNHIIDEVIDKCRQHDAKLLLNLPSKDFAQHRADGWHLSSAEMLTLSERPCAQNQLLGASTHNLEQALKAQDLGVDFVVISPVKPTTSHPEATPIGWEAAQQVASQLNIPVYFLGGLCAQDLDRAQSYGAQGVAGISQL